MAYVVGPENAQPELAGGTLQSGSPGSAVEFGIQVPEDRYARDGPNGFLQEFELLGESLSGNRVGDPSDVSAWAGETRDETLTNRIGARGGHDNRNCRRRDLRRLHRNRPSDQDHSDVCLYQLGSHGAQVPEILCEPMLKFEIPALKKASSRRPCSNARHPWVFSMHE